MWLRSWACTMRVTRWWQRTWSCRPSPRTSTCMACGAARLQVGSARGSDALCGVGGVHPSSQRACSPGFPKALRSCEQLTEYLTVIIFTASAQHAAVNFGQVSGLDPDLRLTLRYLPRALDWVPAGEGPGLLRSVGRRCLLRGGRQLHSWNPGSTGVCVVPSMTGAPGSPMHPPL